MQDGEAGLYSAYAKILYLIFLCIVQSFPFPAFNIGDKFSSFSKVFVKMKKNRYHNYRPINLQKISKFSR